MKRHPNCGSGLGRVHLGKPGIRALGVAESFRQGEARSTLAGVVMRSDLVVDGVAYGRTVVGGDDATGSIVRLYRSFRRNDINLLMVSGCVLSMYNIVDPDGLHRRLGVPVVCLTYKETKGIQASIRRHFPDSYGPKLAAYSRLGERSPVRLASGHRLYVRASGGPLPALAAVVDRFTLQGSIPEPVRLAKLLARARVRSW
jgi:uncharacterized protein